jgi:hypothetical protein
MAKYATMTTGTLGQLAQANRQITTELKEQIRLTRQAASGVPGAGQGNSPYVVPGRTPELEPDGLSLGGLKGAAKFGKLGGNIAERGIGALASGGSLKEVGMLLGEEAITSTVMRIFPIAFTAYAAGEFIAEKVVDHIIGSTKEQVQAIIEDGRRIDRQNRKGIDVELRQVLAGAAIKDAKTQLYKEATNTQRALLDTAEGELGKTFQPATGLLRMAYRSYFDDLEKKKGEIEADLEDNLQRATQQGSSALIGAGISSREKIIADLRARNEPLRESRIAQEIQETVLLEARKEMDNYFKRQRALEKERVAAEKLAIDMNPSLPCIRKQQENWLRSVEQDQMNRSMAWTSY